jgi:hypothetical protein
VKRVARHLPVLAALVALAAPVTAAASPSQVIRDCSDDGALNGKYTNRELRKAKSQLPTDLAEYSDCREIIAAAITSGSDRGGGRGSPGAGVGGAGAADPDEAAARGADAAALDAITGAAKNGEAPSVNVGGEEVTPGTNGLFDLASASNEVPTPLLLALIGLGLLALAGGFVALRGRVPQLNKIPTPRVPFGKRR